MIRASRERDGRVRAPGPPSRSVGEWLRSDPLGHLYLAATLAAFAFTALAWAFGVTA